MQRRVIEVTPEEVERIISDIHRRKAAKSYIHKATDSRVFKRQKTKIQHSAKSFLSDRDRMFELFLEQAYKNMHLKVV